MQHPAEVLGSMLDEARREAGLTFQQVFDRYQDLGGSASQPNTVRLWFKGKDPKATNLGIVCKVINDELELQGKARSLPDLPYLLVRPEGEVGPDISDPGTDMGRWISESADSTDEERDAA